MNGIKFLAWAAGFFIFTLLLFRVSWFGYGILIVGGLVIVVGAIHSTVTNMREARKRQSEQNAAYIKYALAKAQYSEDLKAYNAAQAEAAKRAGWH